jgi:hypothetical protein
MAIIDWSSASDEGAKNLAFQQLSRITQQLVRGATWETLSQHVIVKVVQEMYVRLGIRLTKTKLGDAIPFAGIVIGAGMNAKILHSIATDAQFAYRLRHLSEKYGLDATTSAKASEPPIGQNSDIIDVAEILEETQREELLPHQDAELSQHT